MTPPARGGRSTTQDRLLFESSIPVSRPAYGRLVAFAMRNLHRVARPFQALLPVFRWGGSLYVTRFDDVQTALQDDSVFSIPFQPRMAELDETRSVSVLGMADAAEHQAELLRVTDGMRLADLDVFGKSWAAEAERIVKGAEQIAKGAATELDAVGALLAPMTLRAAEDQFGFKFSDPDAFWHWTMALSDYTFGGTPSAALRQATRAAGRLVDAELDAHIAGLKPHAKDDSVLGRLLIRQNVTGSPSDDQIRAIVAGLLTGMLPNVPIAGRNVLEVLLRRPEAMAAARAAAAVAGDDALLKGCISEALRFYPLYPGPTRVCVAKAGVSIGPRRLLRGPVRVARGEQVIPCTLAGMFDPRQLTDPAAFDPSRAPLANMAFGSGKHWCLGAPLALKVLTVTLRPLLLRQNLRRKPGARTTCFLDFFPETYEVEFERQRH